MKYNVYLANTLMVSSKLYETRQDTGSCSVDRYGSCGEKQLVKKKQQ